MATTTITTTAPALSLSEAAPPDTPHNVQTTLNYYLDTGKPPGPYIVGQPESYKKDYHVLAQTIHDARGHEADYTLDEHGFQFTRHASKVTDFADSEHVKAAYYPETEQLLKDVTGATRIFIFDHTVRGATAAAGASEDVLRKPVTNVHVDQSYEAARARVPFHLPEEAERLLQTRHAIINVWRPLRRVFKDPLAIADARSVPEADLVAVPLVYPNRTGHTYSVRPNAAHQWHFLYGQGTDEVTLIKCFDSKTDGRARRVPHSAFVDPAHEDGYQRQSIEIRALVFFEDQAAE